MSLTETHSQQDVGREHHVLVLAACAFVLLAAAFFRLQPTGEHAVVAFGYQLPDVCAYRQITGLWCPGCGLTRSFVSLAHGQLGDSVGFNPLGPLLFLIVAAQVPLRSFALFRRGAPLSGWMSRANADFGKTMLIALLLLGAIRLQWGLAHQNLIKTDAEPPADWATTIILLFVSWALLWAGQKLPKLRTVLRARFAKQS